jgi:hypothetical protein
MLKVMVGSLATAISRMIDPRTGSNISYSPNDIIMCAFSLFFAQDGSFLQFQRRMKDKRQISNLETLFGVQNIPTDDQIRNFIDLIDPIYFNKVYYDILKLLYNQKALERFLVLNNKYLAIALDGSQYFSSQKICCNNCIVKEHRNGNIEYVHNILGASIV